MFTVDVKQQYNNNNCFRCNFTGKLSSIIKEHFIEKKRLVYDVVQCELILHHYSGWLVGCFGFNSPLSQYFSLYLAVSQREGERRERIDESKNVQTTPPAPTASAKGPCPTVIKIVGRPGTIVNE